MVLFSPTSKLDRDSFDQSLEAVAFPESLQTLKFGHAFRQPLERVTLPQGLRSLTFCRESRRRAVVGLPQRTLELQHQLRGLPPPQGPQVPPRSPNTGLRRRDFAKQTSMFDLRWGFQPELDRFGSPKQP